MASNLSSLLNFKSLGQTQEENARLSAFGAGGNFNLNPTQAPQNPLFGAPQQKISNQLTGGVMQTAYNPQNSVQSGLAAQTGTGGGLFAPPTGTNAGSPATATQIPGDWIKPGGGFYTAKEVVDNMVMKQQGGDVPRYAGDVLTQGPQTTEQLQMTAAELNNARNDIATGATDPYKAANQSGIPYTFAELNAIQKAYAGVYDPAINSALAKLDAKQKQEERTSSTNEQIRQYEATTGKHRASGGIAPLGLKRGEDHFVDPYAYVQKALAFEAQGGTMKKFLNDYPPNDYLNPVSLNNPEIIPEFMRKAMSASVQQQSKENQAILDYTAWLAVPGNEALSNTQKAEVLVGLGLDPTEQKFNLFLF